MSDWNEWTLMGGTELVDALLSECIPETPSSLCASRRSDIVPLISSLLVALVLKAILTVVTFGVRFMTIPLLNINLIMLDQSPCWHIHPYNVCWCTLRSLDWIDTSDGYSQASTMVDI